MKNPLALNIVKSWLREHRFSAGSMSVAVVALAVVGFVATRDSTRPAAANALSTAAAGQAKPVASPTATVSPSPTPSPSPKPSPPPDLNPHLGSKGPDVLAIQQRLAGLMYLVGAVDGTFGAGTRDGVIAFQKVEGLKRTGEADPATLAKLPVASTPAPAYATPADHVELDVAHQVVLVVRGGAVTAILQTSTGSGQAFTSEGYTRKAITPNGAFQVYWRVPGWHKAPLGELYKPSFFNDGIAFHGYYSVPTYPASHGCARLPMEFADWFYDNATPMGSTVYVYGGTNGPNPAPQKETSGAIEAPPPPDASPSPSPAPSPGSQPGVSPTAVPAPMPSPLPSPAPSPSFFTPPPPSPTPVPPPGPSPIPVVAPTPAAAPSPAPGSGPAP